MKIILFIVMLCCSVIASKAQTVESIRKDYSQAIEHTKMMADPDYPPCNRYQLVFEQMLGGSGQHKETLTMYYYQEQNENDPGTTINTPYYFTTRYNYAGQIYHEEYLYTEKGKVEFIYALDLDFEDLSEVEYRFYIASSGVIKLIVNRKKSGESKFTQEYAGNTVSKYSSAYNKYLDKSVKLAKMFASIEAYQE